MNILYIYISSISKKCSFWWVWSAPPTPKQETSNEEECYVYFLTRTVWGIVFQKNVRFLGLHRSLRPKTPLLLKVTQNHTLDSGVYLYFINHQFKTQSHQYFKRINIRIHTSIGIFKISVPEYLVMQFLNRKQTKHLIIQQIRLYKVKKQILSHF